MNFRRVVVALDASSPASALAMAVDLARAMDIEIVGLFVEDADLIQLAALPFAREVGFPSAVRRDLDVTAIERSLRAHACRVRDEFGRRLAGETVKWTFEIVRGPVVEVLATAMGERDLAIVSVSGTGTRSRAGVARAFESSRTPLFVVGESSPNPDTTIILPTPQLAAADIDEIVAVLARQHGVPALFVVADADAARWQPRYGEMRALLARRGIPSRIRALARATRVELGRVVAEERARLVIVLAGPETLEALLDALSRERGTFTARAR
jgi:hypothetical protein